MCPHTLTSHPIKSPTPKKNKQEAAAAATAAAPKGKGQTSRPERKRKGGKKKGEEEEQEEEGSSKAVPLSAADRETLSGILEVVAALWASVQGELGEVRGRGGGMRFFAIDLCTRRGWEG